jgi:hypothetical protein
MSVIILKGWGVPRRVRTCASRPAVPASIRVSARIRGMYVIILKGWGRRLALGYVGVDTGAAAARSQY